MKEIIEFLKKLHQELNETKSETLDVEELNDFLKGQEKGVSVWDVYKYIRGEINHEYTLLTGRITWYIACQSFLLTVYAISYSNHNGPNWFSNVLLPLLAVVISFFAYFMIEGATATIDMWTKMRIELTVKFPGLCSFLISRWHPDNIEDFIHKRALLFPKYISGIFAITWILIAVLSFIFPWVVCA